MKVHRFRQILSALLVLSMMFSLTATAFASGHTESFPPETYVQEIVDGDIFIQRSDSKIVAIATGNTEHILDISILYPSDTAVIYHWLIDDYPVVVFSPDDLSFWTDIIEFAEQRTTEADLIESPSIQEAIEHEPMPFSSAGADLAAGLRELVGAQYSNKFIPPLKMIESHTYRLYETMEYQITKANQLSWANAMTVSSIVVSVVGILLPPVGAMQQICTVLGIAFQGAATLIPPGKMNRYNCMVMYTRYVTIDGGGRQYGPAYKVRYFDGYEDADLNSTGRAQVLPNDDPPYYGSQSEEFFNNGIFIDAYKTFNNIL